MELSFGIVKITAGPFRGRVGYYDNDEDDEAMVYFGHPIEDAANYEAIPCDALGLATEAEAQAWIAETGFSAALAEPE